MGRSPCCSKVGLRRGPWSTKEDNLLTNYIHHHGEGQWRSLPKKAGLLRCGKSCRLRWMNYLRPGIKRGNITEDEEDLIVRLHGLLGNRWSLIAGRLPGRTDNEIKNYWNTHLLKKLNTLSNNNKAVHGKKKTKHKKKAQGNKLPTAVPVPVPENKAEEEIIAHKTKVYLPKPIRVSSAFSRTNSYDSLVSDGGEPVAWPPLFELEDSDDFLGYVLPVIHHSDSILSSDVNMLDKVYDEYLQLL